MKFRITLKDPDGVYESLQAAVYQVLKEEGVPEHRQEDLYHGVEEELTHLTKRWLRFGEYVTIEFDTEAETARVVPCNE